MSGGERRPPNRGWMDWEPSKPIIAESPQSEPTEPTKPGFEGFVGSPLAAPAKIGTEDPGASGGSDAPSLPHRKASIPARVDCSAATERVMSLCEWKAAALNELFLKQGVTGQPGRITPDTVRDGEQKQGSGDRCRPTDWKG
jgi:hypothetical protein